jgi:hypothetical protein
VVDIFNRNHAIEACKVELNPVLPDLKLDIRNATIEGTAERLKYNKSLIEIGSLDSERVASISVPFEIVEYERPRADIRVRIEYSTASGTFNYVYRLCRLDVGNRG